MSAYKVGGIHQHTPEMEQTLSAAAGARVTLSFTPLLAPMPRGIVATCTCRHEPGGRGCSARCAGRGIPRREVRAGPARRVLASDELGGGDQHGARAECLRRACGRVIVVCAIDNLGKGAAGQALQNANLYPWPRRGVGPDDEWSRTVTVTSAKGFRASGVRAGLKSSGDPDLALVVNDGPLDVAAAVFTSNRFKAAPVLWSQQVVADGEIRAVVLNSGGANACTGPGGFGDTHHTAEHVAATLVGQGMRIGPGDVAVCSTGLIGERLPLHLIFGGIEAAAGSLSGMVAGMLPRPSARQTPWRRWRQSPSTDSLSVAWPRGQACSARSRDDAGGDHDRRCRQRGSGRPGPPRSMCADLRPDRLGWLHEHQRHGVPPCIRCVGGSRRHRSSSRTS